MNNQKNSLNSYAKYSGISFKMIVIILLGVFAGKYIDDYFNIKPIGILVLTLLSCGLSFYNLIKDLTKKNES